MSQMPPAPGQPTPPGGYSPAAQTNGWGVASLVTGIISFCIPLLGGLLAVIFGIVGLRRAKTTQTGKGYAVTGLIFGLITLVGWAVFFCIFGFAAVLGIHSAIQTITAPQEAAKQFVRDLHAGNLNAAKADTDGSLSQSELQSLSDAVKDLGAVRDITNTSTNVVNESADLKGVATFEKGTKNYSVHEVKGSNGWKISAMTFDQTPSAPTSRTAGEGE